MKSKRFFAALISMLSVLLFASSSALAATIDFEDATPQVDILDTRYSGVTFDAGFDIIAFDWTLLGFSAHSGKNVLLAMSPDFKAYTNQLWVVFSSDMDQVGAWMGNDQGSGGVTWTLELFDADGNPVGSPTTLDGNNNIHVDQYLFNDSAAFRKAKFSSNVGTLAIVLDDLTYSSVQTSSVPVPAAVWLLASGLTGIVALRRRLTK